MFVVLVFIHTCYISISCANGYVLFAANIEDFRTIAKKIIPAQLADQLADMAARSSLNLRQGPERYEDDDEDSSNGDDVSSNEYSDTARFTKPFLRNTALRKTKIHPQNKYSTGKHQNVDIDELVKRVKEELVREYNIQTTEANTEPNFLITEINSKKIDDYYYKDERLNDEPSNDDTYDEQMTTKNHFTRAIPNYAYVPGYNGETEDLEGVEVKEVEENLKPVYNNNRNKAKARPIADAETEKEYYEDVTVEPQHGGNIKEVVGTIDVNAGTPEYYEDNAKAVQDPGVNNEDMFKGVDLLKKKDSYEDYVTPKRDSVFESEENAKRPGVWGEQKFAPIKYTPNAPETTKAVARNDNPVIEKASYNPIQSRLPTSSKPLTLSPVPQEIKAKTESLWYKDPNFANYDDSTRPTPKDNNLKTKRFNTMFPTKGHYKLSTPNYYAKLPAVAEKYNFNEELPENDREPESIKYIGNPPALINKKVKV